MWSTSFRLEWANLKLGDVVSDVMGVSARAMLTALSGGTAEPAVLAELAKGRLRGKRAELERALSGQLRAHHRFLLAQHLEHIDYLEEQIAAFDQQIAHLVDQPPPATPPNALASIEVPGSPGADGLPWDEALQLLDTVPGVGRRMAEILIAEIGTDMGQFPSAAHLASWAKVAPGNNESAGKRRTGKTGRGSRWLRSALIQAAYAAVRVPGSHLQAVYRRLMVRRGSKKAIVAVAHRLLVASYYMLKEREPYRELGTRPLPEAARAKLATRLQNRLEKLGYTVHLNQAAPELTPAM